MQHEEGLVLRQQLLLTSWLPGQPQLQQDGYPPDYKEGEQL